MVEQQQKLVLSPYMDIYELVIPKDNLLRQMKELVDFSFIYEELIDKYCLDNGRNAIPPVRMFKYLLLKSIYDLSDIDIVERSKYDMSFKYFLDMAPEESVINPSSLTKFRKLRLKDMNLLDMLITKTVRTALEKGIIKSKSIIADDIPPMVEQWREQVEFYADMYEVSEYVDLLLAIIAQESGGNADKVPDIMQCSASAGKTITDPIASIRQGTYYFSTLLASGTDKGGRRCFDRST